MPISVGHSIVATTAPYDLQMRAAIQAFAPDSHIIYNKRETTRDGRAQLLIALGMRGWNHSGAMTEAVSTMHGGATSLHNRQIIRRAVALRPNHQIGSVKSRQCRPQAMVYRNGEAIQTADGGSHRQKNGVPGRRRRW